MIATPLPQGLALRLSVTDRCQLRCRYCMPEEGVPLGSRAEILSYEEIARLTAWLRDEFGLARVRITGGEPLIRQGIEQLVAMLAGLGVEDLALTTNGLRLPEMARALRQAGLKRVNVSLDTLSPATFRSLAGTGDLQSVLDGIDAAQDAGLLPVKLNTVVIRGVNDREVSRILAFALERNCEARFIELMPIGPGASLFAGGFVSSDAVLEILSRDFALVPAVTPAGTSARRYHVTDAQGRRGAAGFISSCSAPFCDGCTRLRATADGRLIGCLARDGGISIREWLRSGNRQGVVDAARHVLMGKTADRVFEQGLAMASIGG